MRTQSVYAVLINSISRTVGGGGGGGSGGGGLRVRQEREQKKEVRRVSSMRVEIHPRNEDELCCYRRSFEML